MKEWCLTHPWMTFFIVWGAFAALTAWANAVREIVRRR